MLRECTFVWVVSDVNRAASDKAAWEILKSSMTDMVQGGACTGITFICTKTDDMNAEEYMRSQKSVFFISIFCLCNCMQYSRVCSLYCLFSLLGY